jgi:hypothetical protein
MSGRPAFIRQRDLKQTIFAAIKAGAKQVRVKLSEGAEVIIPLIDDEKRHYNSGRHCACDPRSQTDRRCRG